MAGHIAATSRQPRGNMAGHILILPAISASSKKTSYTYVRTYLRKVGSYIPPIQGLAGLRARESLIYSYVTVVWIFANSFGDYALPKDFCQ